jgi:DNA-binding GntR family transcriptional regulator
MSDSQDLVLGLRQQIADRVRLDVLSGRLAEGESLREKDLVARFGVSRTPIREALLQLTHEGLLEGHPNRGVKVARTAPDSIREFVVPIRRTVETYALRTFFSEIDEADFRRWDEILARLREACQRRDFAGTAEYDIAFHRSIIERAGEPALLAIWSTIVAQVRRHFRTVHESYQDPLEIHAEHAAIVETIRSGDEQAATAALAANIA